MAHNEQHLFRAAGAQAVPIAELCQNLSNLLTRIQSPIDAKLRGLRSVYNELGSKGVEAVMLGLSRKIRTTREDAQRVILEWERREISCCFQEGVHALLKLTDTCVLAVSYKHVEMTKWYRHGQHLIAKMSDRDQEALVNVVEGCSKIPDARYVILWCDQVISTRLKDGNKENSMGWYNAGLIPYACFPVLKLSSYIADEVLESRVWLKAERSLGRLGLGTVEVCDAVRGRLEDPGAGNSVSMIMRSIAGMILSGFWPKDMGFWQNDYLQMKKWAVSVLANSQVIVEPPIFAEVRGVDNLELLSIMDEFVHVPKGLQHAEQPVHTNDRLFFLKVTAWNMHVQDIWNFDGKTVSHYMGDIAPFYKFSWWANESMDVIFGFLRGLGNATFVLAMEDGSGYSLHRIGVDPALYSHADKFPTDKTLHVLEEVASRFGVALTFSQKWSLLYSSADDVDTRHTDPVLRHGLEAWPTLRDCFVPQVYYGLTTKLYRCAVVKDGSTEQVAQRFLRILKSWNRYVREEFENYISVTDTPAGAIWLEGFSEHRVSFGFYDYMTRSLILRDNSFSHVGVTLPSKWEFIQEIRQIARSSTKYVQVLVDEVFGSATESNCNELVYHKDVACFMARGGLAASMKGPQLSGFLCRAAAHRGYWITKVYAREGKMQIIFKNQDGEVRIAHRATSLSEFHTFGVVRPKDDRAVYELSVPVEDDPEDYEMSLYWKPMDSNTSIDQLRTVFANSMYADEGDKHVLLVDMSVIEKGVEHSVVDIEKTSSSVDQAYAQLSGILDGIIQSDSVENHSETGTNRGGRGSLDESASAENIFAKQFATIMDLPRRCAELQDRGMTVLTEFAERQREPQTPDFSGGQNSTGGFKNSRRK